MKESTGEQEGGKETEREESEKRKWREKRVTE